MSEWDAEDGHRRDELAWQEWEQMKAEMAMSDSRKRFEEWFEPNELSRELLKHWRTESGYREESWYLNGCWKGWSARDSEVERLREALRGFLAEFGDKAMNANVRNARALLSPQDKESA